MEENKKIKDEELMKGEMENTSECLSDDDLDDVVGGAFAGIPRVKVHKIDQSLRDKI